MRLLYFVKSITWHSIFPQQKTERNLKKYSDHDSQNSFTLRNQSAQKRDLHVSRSLFFSFRLISPSLFVSLRKPDPILSYSDKEVLFRTGISAFICYLKQTV